MTDLFARLSQYIAEVRCGVTGHVWSAWIYYSFWKRGDPPESGWRQWCKRCGDCQYKGVCWDDPKPVKHDLPGDEWKERA